MTTRLLDNVAELLTCVADAAAAMHTLVTTIGVARTQLSGDR